ncbi:MAG: hypothetical protein AAF675_11245 [Pseudomonadota bacterium]
MSGTEPAARLARLEGQGSTARLVVDGSLRLNEAPKAQEEALTALTGSDGPLAIALAPEPATVPALQIALAAAAWLEREDRLASEPSFEPLLVPSAGPNEEVAA